LRLYEGMFIVDPAGLGKEEGTPEDLVKGLLDRRQAEILHSERWAERKFSYDIRGKKKGVYVLTYFRAPTGGIRELVHDCELSDKVIRVLVLKDEDGELEREMQLRKEALLTRPPAGPEGESGEAGAAPPSAEGVEEGAGEETARKPSRRRAGRIEEYEDVDEGGDGVPSENEVGEMEGIDLTDESVDLEDVEEPEGSGEDEGFEAKGGYK